MLAKEAIKDVRNNVINAKDQGHETVAIEAFLKFLDRYEQDIEGVEEVDRYQHESNLAQFRADNERFLANERDMFRSVIDYGHMAIKNALLVNGGAAIAILAFIGNLLSKDCPPENIRPLAFAIVAFPGGALFAGLSACSSYFAQYYYAKKRMQLGDIMRAITIAFVLAAYGSFAYGAWSCYVAFSASLPESGIKGPAFRQAPAAAKKP